MQGLKKDLGEFLAQEVLKTPCPTFTASKLAFTQTTTKKDADSKLSIQEPIAAFGPYLFNQLEAEKEEMTYEEALVRSSSLNLNNFNLSFICSPIVLKFNIKKSRISPGLSKVTPSNPPEMTPGCSVLTTSGPQ